jgi:hypothetical protein
MPVCNRCKKFSNCLTVDFCEHCGAKDWQQGTVLKPAVNEPKFDFDNVYGCLWNISVLLFLFGGLWLLVAAVKWMWRHS